jgi:hypothetical protein
MLGWHEYRNERYHYRILIPSTGVAETVARESPEPEVNAVPESCVLVSDDAAMLYIRTPDAMTRCRLAIASSQYGEYRAESLRVNGKYYRAVGYHRDGVAEYKGERISGYVREDAEPGYRTAEQMDVTLDDGTHFSYGILMDRHMSDGEVTAEHAFLRDIIQSYKRL